MIGKCQYCNTDNKDLRPYGRNGAMICYSCGMKPENIEETRSQFSEVIKDVDTVVVIDGLTIN